ncbi:MAG: hypothetical protein ACHQTE_00560, partial [Candidatus Saccharimonadales bacterium]
PFDLQVPTHSGALETLHLVQGITAVNTDWLIDLAPHMFASRHSKTYYDPRSGSLATRQLVRFGGQVLEGAGTPISDNTPQNRRAFSDGFAIWAYEQLERERRQLGRFHTKRIPMIPLRQLQQQVKVIAGHVVSLDELNPTQRTKLTNLARLHTHVGDEFMAKLGTTYRSDARETRQRGWKPAHKRKFNRHREGR